MYHLLEVPIPDSTHYIGMVYLYEEEGERKFMTIKDGSAEKEHVRIKFPGGSSEKIYEEYVLFENNLFKILEKLNFERKAQIKILKNERKKKELAEGYGKNEAIAFILRTMVLESLEKIGYYPMDTEPTVIEVFEKAGHTQYFVEIKTFIDATGNEIVIPNNEDNFKSSNRDIIETRFALPTKEYESLIHAHKKAAEGYLKANKR